MSVPVDATLTLDVHSVEPKPNPARAEPDVAEHMVDYRSIISHYSGGRLINGGK